MIADPNVATASTYIFMVFPFPSISFLRRDLENRAVAFMAKLLFSSSDECQQRPTNLIHGNDNLGEHLGPLPRPLRDGHPIRVGPGPGTSARRMNVSPKFCSRMFRALPGTFPFFPSGRLGCVLRLVVSIRRAPQLFPQGFLRVNAWQTCFPQILVQGWNSSFPQHAPLLAQNGALFLEFLLHCRRLCGWRGIRTVRHGQNRGEMLIEGRKIFRLLPAGRQAKEGALGGSFEFRALLI